VSSQSVRDTRNLASLEIVGSVSPRVEPLAPKLPAQPTSTPELIDSVELARRLSLPDSWVRSHTRQRTSDEIPSVRFGRWVRFDWNSPALRRWIQGHERGSRG
jgi:hypothetical protein